MRPRHPLASLWDEGVLPFAALLVIVLAMLTSGCKSTTPAKVASNTLRDALFAAAEKLEAECITPYDPAQITATDPREREEWADRLRKAYRRSECPAALRVYDDALTAHVTIHAVVGAYEVGECVNVSRSVARCNLAAAMADAYAAASRIADRMATFRGAK